MVNNSGTLVVRLLKDVQSFGRKGAIVPVATGMMRNKWFPERLAEYIPAIETKQLRANGTVVSRDFDFGVDRSRIEIAEEAQEQEELEVARKPIEPEGISPERSRELMNIFVDSTLEFRREVIPAPRKEAQPRSVSLAAADLLASRGTDQAIYEETAPIYGSVVTSDVAAAIREALSRNDEASTITVDPEDITFTGLSAEQAETGRIKNCGSFKVEIRLKGLDEPLARTIRVKARDS